MLGDEERYVVSWRSHPCPVSVCPGMSSHIFAVCGDPGVVVVGVEEQSSSVGGFERESVSSGDEVRGRYGFSI